MKSEEYSELLQTELDSNLLQVLDVYGRTRQIISRTRAALGQTPRVVVTRSSAKQVRIINGANFSTKVYTGK